MSRARERRLSRLELPGLAGMDAAARIGVKAGMPPGARQLDALLGHGLLFEKRREELLAGGGSEAPTSLLVPRGSKASPELRLRRRPVEVPDLLATLVRPGVGYMRVRRFEAGTARRLCGELDRLEERSGSLHALVLDLRESPGGRPDEAVGEAGAAAEARAGGQRTERELDASSEREREPVLGRRVPPGPRSRHRSGDSGA